MTPQEKAKELVDKYIEPCKHHNFTESHGWELDVKETNKSAKACAIIAVDLIGDDMFADYWKNVKEEIKKL